MRPHFGVGPDPPVSGAGHPHATGVVWAPAGGLPLVPTWLPARPLARVGEDSRTLGVLIQCYLICPSAPALAAGGPSAVPRGPDTPCPVGLLRGRLSSSWCLAEAPGSPALPPPPRVRPSRGPEPGVVHRAGSPAWSAAPAGAPPVPSGVLGCGRPATLGRAIHFAESAGSNADVAGPSLADAPESDAAPVGRRAHMQSAVCV